MLFEMKFAWRSLLKARGFTAAAVLILALSIAANTAVFSVVDGVLVKPLPYVRPGELYLFQSATANQLGLFNVLEYCTYRDRSRAFNDLIAIGTMNTTLADQSEAQLVQGLKLSASTFTALGLRPAAGRLLVPDDDRAEAPKVAVIGNALWYNHFGGKTEVIGRSVQIGGEPYTIVGVLPPEFILPVNGFNSDICVPLQADLSPERSRPAALHYLRVFARIAPGISRGQALADSSRILDEIRHEFPKDYAGDPQNVLRPLADEIVGDTRPVLLTLLCVVGALLLLACANLAGLLLVRTIGRQRELAIRSALGGSRSQLLRLLLAECAILAAIGGVAGLILTRWGLDLLLSLLPAGLPRMHELRLNGSVFAFAGIASVIAGLAPALAPLWIVSRTDLRAAFSSGGRSATPTARHQRLRHFLASIQISLALILLVCTGLFLKSFWALGSQSMGFEPSHTLTAKLTLPAAGYRDRRSLIAYYERLRPRLASIPGVLQVGTTSLLPLVGGLSTANFTIEGHPPANDADHPSANYRVVSQGFFEAMGIPLRQGRFLTEEDDDKHPFSIVVGAALADSLFPGHNALGKRLFVEDLESGARPAEIVGVVGDVKQSKLEDGATFDIYVSLRQMSSVSVPWIRYRNFWVLRTSTTPQLIEAAVRREIRAVDPGVPVTSVRTLEQVAHSAAAVRKFSLVIIGFFSAAALLLTIAGVYAVIAYGVGQRTREIGIRLALGATAGRILWLILSEGFGLVLTGSIVGVGVAIGLSHLIAAQLYGVNPRDPVAFAACVTFMFAIVFVASLLPAMRAAKVDPGVALHSD
jgi:predicted permease